VTRGRRRRPRGRDRVGGASGARRSRRRGCGRSGRRRSRRSRSRCRPATTAALRYLLEQLGGPGADRVHAVDQGAARRGARSFEHDPSSGLDAGPAGGFDDVDDRRAQELGSLSSTEWPVCTTICSASGLSANQPRCLSTLARNRGRSPRSSAEAISAAVYSLLITVTGMSPISRRAAHASLYTCR
jgi:hypothetical protein